MNTDPNNSAGVMDAPDIQVRIAANRVQTGVPLTHPVSPLERRLAIRQALEAQNNRASTGLTRTTQPPVGAGSFWRNNGNGTSTQGTFAGPQTTTGLARITPNGTPASPPAIRTALTPALPPAIPAAIQPALNSPGAVVPSPATVPQQRESVNPLSGSLGTSQPAGTTAPINPGRALGASQRGTSVPRGQDAAPDANVGGTGLYKRRFNTPGSAKVYGDYVRSLFKGSGGSDDDEDD